MPTAFAAAAADAEDSSGTDAVAAAALTARGLSRLNTSPFAFKRSKIQADTGGSALLTRLGVGWRRACAAGAVTDVRALIEGALARSPDLGLSRSEYRAATLLQVELVADDLVIGDDAVFDDAIAAAPTAPPPTATTLHTMIAKRCCRGTGTPFIQLVGE